MGHITAPLPENEKERLEALSLYNLLDTLPEQSFDDLTSIASYICNTPISLISLIDSNRQWFKSHHGLDATQTSREQAFCAHAILSPNEPMIVEDARCDERFSDNPLVINEPRVIAYAGMPLTDQNGMPLGTLCVIDNQPKQFTKSEIDHLVILARQVIQLIEIRKINQELLNTNHELNKLKDINNQCQKITKIGAWELNIETGKTIWTDEVYNIHDVDVNYDHNLRNGIDFYDPEDRPILSAAIENTIKTGEEFNLNLRLITAKNKKKWVHTSGRKAYCINNEPILIGVFRDITDEIEIQQKLDHELFRNQCILEGTNVGTWEWNVQSGETKFNERWAEIIGYSLSELEPISIETWLKFVHPDDMEESGRKLQLCFDRKSEFYEIEARMRHKDGHWVWVFDRGKVFSWTEDGKPLMMYGTHQDISENKYKEEDLRYQKELFNAIFELLPIGVALNDLQTGVFLDVNSKLLEPTGYTKEEFLRLSYWDVTPTKYQSKESEALNEIKQKGYYSSFEKEYIKKDGTLYPVKLNGLLITDLNGRKMLLSLVEDISRQKLDQLTLQKAKEAAESATFAKSQFLANMSHEIRTPLTSIIGFAEAAKEDGVSSTDRLKAFETIFSNGQHLLGIINDILDLSKMEAGALKLELLPLSPVDLVENVRSLMLPRLADKGLSLLVNYKWELPKTVLSDSLRLTQVLINLVSNALKFTENGRVEITVWCDRENEQLHFEIMDTGIGISKEYISNIFQPFSQAEEGTTRIYGGTGLGLSISSQLINKLGGKISVKSELNIGSTFSFSINTGVLSNTEWISSIPVKLNEALVEKKINRTLSGRVLIADDVEDNRKLLEFTLSKTDLEVTLVENGEQALNQAMTGQFDIILLDMRMPVMDGYTAAREVRKNGIKIPIVALTANTMKHSILKCIEAGCTTFLPKPYGKDELIECLYQQISSSRLSNRNAGGVISEKFKEDPDALSIILSFVNGLENRIHDLFDAIEKEDYYKLEEVAHQLSGSAGLFGYSLMCELATLLEESAIENQLKDARRIFEQVKSAHAAIIIGAAEMKTTLKTLGSQVTI